MISDTEKLQRIREIANGQVGIAWTEVRRILDPHSDPIDLSRPTVTPEQVCPACEADAQFRIIYDGNKKVAEECPACQIWWIPKERR